ASDRRDAALGGRFDGLRSVDPAAGRSFSSPVAFRHDRFAGTAGPGGGISAAHGADAGAADLVRTRCGLSDAVAAGSRGAGPDPFGAVGPAGREPALVAAGARAGTPAAARPLGAPAGGARVGAVLVVPADVVR